jgi:hypothetical protein
MNPSELLPPVHAHFAQIAEACKPKLHSKEESPLRVVKVEKDETAVLGWKTVECEKEEDGRDMPVLVAGDSVILDFGESYILSARHSSMSWNDHKARRRGYLLYFKNTD